jgi:isopentenyl-diphosphate delta-isomerase
MSKPVVLVDEKDNVLGYVEKFATHKIPVALHRAISILIFNKDKSQMLITKRADDKPTWGGFWSNAVCTHPFPDETYREAAERRIFEELGFKTPLKEVLNFSYSAEMDNKVWGEHELDHVFVGIYDGPVNPDPNEVSDYKWVKIEELKKGLKNNPDKYTPWFEIIMERI